MKRRIASVIATFGLGVGLTFANLVGTAGASFNPNRIIDDSVFDTTNTMTETEINTFLNQYTNSCISTNNGFTAPDPTGYRPSPSEFLYSSTPVSAGKVISDAAEAYELNPRVLLTTLEKEENLVTGSQGCATWRYASALGYGCTDSGTNTHDYSYPGGGLVTPLYYHNGTAVNSITGSCVNSGPKAGFSEQVIHAAWLLKFSEQRSEGNINWAVIKGSWDNSDDPQSCYSGFMTQGTWQQCPSGPISPYDGNATIDNTGSCAGLPTSVNVHMDNGATAALYVYTPHICGNSSFFTIWEGWFGTGSTFTPSFAWQNISMVIMDEGKNGAIPTDYMHPGERLFVDLTVKNTGSVTWQRDGANPMRLGTIDPQNHYTPYCDITWINCHRLASLTEASVAPGATGHFQFYMAVPNTPGEYREFVEPVAELQSWMSNDIGFNIYVRDANVYDWKWKYFDAYTDATKTTKVDMNNLAKGQQVYIVLHVLNRSATVWSNSGSHPVDLGTSNPQDQKSVVCAAGWQSCNRPATMDQATVVPGQEATFSFMIKAPTGTGQYRQFFKPVIEYKGWMRDDTNHIYMNVTH